MKIGLDFFDTGKRRKAECLLRLLKAKDVGNPEHWVKMDLENETEAEVASAVLLTKIWLEAIDDWRDDQDWIEGQIEQAQEDPQGPFADAGLALERILQAGVDQNDLAAVARYIAFTTAQTIMSILGHVAFDEELSDLEEAARPGDSFPGWALVETVTTWGPKGQSSVLSGRGLAGLEDYLLGMDPSGKEGRP